MESLLPIIIGVVFVIMQAVKSSKKKEAARRRQMQMPREETIFSPQPREKTPFEQWLENVDRQNTMEVVEEDEEVEEPSLEQVLYPNAKEQFIEGESALQSVESILAALNESQSDEEKEAFAEHTHKGYKLFDENFDVKKGIIFSEVFRPKFD